VTRGNGPAGIRQRAAAGSEGEDLSILGDGVLAGVVLFDYIEPMRVRQAGRVVVAQDELFWPWPPRRPHRPALLMCVASNICSPSWSRASFTQVSIDGSRHQQPVLSNVGKAAFIGWFQSA
jgi:hypothetical protein